MLSLPSHEQRSERPTALIGILGSFVALASFFLLPVGYAGIGSQLLPTNGWEVSRFLLTPPFGPGTIIGLFLVLLLPGCCCVTLVLGGLALVRPVPRHWARLYTLALLPGLVLLCCAFFLYFAAIASLWGFWGMIAGYLGILVGRAAFTRESAQVFTPRGGLVSLPATGA
jgi:hypothetical protein